MSGSFLSVALMRAADAAAGSSTGDEVAAASINMLPHELLVHVAERLPGKPALAFASCSKSLRSAGLNDDAWSRRLEWEMGFTSAGIANWLAGGRTRVECFLYHFVKHEALEVEWLMPPKPVRAPGWRGCCDVRVCLELVNRWPMPIWTLFTHHTDEPSFASDDGVVLNGDANAFCSTFEASHGRGQTQRLFSLGGHAGRRPLPPTAQQDTLLAQGWMRLEADHHVRWHRHAYRIPTCIHTYILRPAITYDGIATPITTPPTVSSVPTVCSSMRMRAHERVCTRAPLGAGGPGELRRAYYLRPAAGRTACAGHHQ